jgi:hypothetical protein
LPLLPDDDLNWMLNYIDDCFWKPSKQSASHAYTVREWRPGHDADFVKFVELIRTYGHPENFYSKTYIYLHIDGLKYWTMGSPIPETIIINRAPSRAFYGRQVAPVMNRTYAETVYDRLSSRYDDRYSTEAYLAENAKLFNALTPHLKGSVLDVGCGTGLMLEYFPTSPFLYLGIDPSQGMMNEFIRKFPSHAFKQQTFDEFNHSGQFDTAIALFGSPSYINPDNYEKLLASGKDYYFMFYKQGYLPDYYTSPDETNTNYERIEQVFDSRHEFGNYLVATNLPIEGTYENL